MRSAVILIATCLVASASAGDIAPDWTGAQLSGFLTYSNNSVEFLDIMRLHFENSLSYLFSSKIWGSQYYERPGLSKYLMGKSDDKWEEGMETLKKYLQRGGRLSTLGTSKLGEAFTFALSKENMFNHMKEDDQGSSYLATISNMLLDTRSTTKNIVSLHRTASHKKDGYHTYDPELALYFEKELHELSEDARELAGFETELSRPKMTTGIALHMFDEHIN